MNYQQATHVYERLMSRHACFTAAEVALKERLEVDKIIAAIDEATAWYHQKRYAAVRDEAVLALVELTVMAEEAKAEAREQVAKYLPYETASARHARGLRASCETFVFDARRAASN